MVSVTCISISFPESARHSVRSLALMIAGPASTPHGFI
jgi:hypothetical protein